jgi:hypothetical protein
MQLEDALVAPKTTTLSASADLVQIYVVAKHPQGAQTITASNFLKAAINALPDSASGLSPGDLYLNSGVVTQVLP